MRREAAHLVQALQTRLWAQNLFLGQLNAESTQLSWITYMRLLERLPRWDLRGSKCGEEIGDPKNNDTLYFSTSCTFNYDAPLT